jgi:phosphoglycolate phosphatase-like HAD superfamily hydrolase
VAALRRELQVELDQDTLARLPDLHAEAYHRHHPSVRPLPGATELLARLDEEGIPWAIATSGSERTAGRARAACSGSPTTRRWSPATWCAMRSPTPTCS